MVTRRVSEQNGRMHREFARGIVETREMESLCFPYFVHRVAHKPNSSEMPVIEHTFLQTDEMSSNPIFPQLRKYLAILRS